MGRRLDGRAIAADVEGRLRRAIAGMRRPPSLGILVAGDVEAHRIYVRQISTAAQRLGVEVSDRTVGSDMDDAASAVEGMAAAFDGVLICHPLPAGMDFESLLEALPPERDAEGLHPSNLGRLISGDIAVVPPTPAACLEVIDGTVPDTTGSEAVIVNHSPILGRPLSVLLQRRDCTVTVCHVHTRDLRLHTRMADILITGAGVPSLVKADMVKPGAVVIDVGTSRSGGAVRGDVDTDAVLGVASAVTPVPGGIGPITVAMLMRNVVGLAGRT